MQRALKRLPSYDPDISPNSNLFISREYRSDPRVRGYDRDINIHESYTVHRNNSNTGGISILDSPKKVNKVKQGFYGEVQAYNDLARISPTYLNNNTRISPVFQSGNEALSPTKLGNQYKLPYNNLPGPLLNNQNSNHYYISKNVSGSLPNVSLPRIYGNSGPSSPLRMPKAVSSIFDLAPEQGLIRMEKIFENQNKQIKRIMESLNGDPLDVEKLKKSNNNNKSPQNKEGAFSNYISNLFDGRKDTLNQDRSMKSLRNKNSKSTWSLPGSEANSPRNAGNPKTTQNLESLSKPSTLLDLQEDVGPKVSCLKERRGRKQKKNNLDENVDINASVRRHVTFRGPVTAKMRLRRVLWTMVYPSLLKKEVDKKVFGQKKLAQEQFNSIQVQEYKNQVLEFIQKHCSGALNNLYNESKNLMLVMEEKGRIGLFGKKDMQRRFKIVAERLIEILETFKASITKTNFPSSVIDFLASISCDNSVLPHRFLTQFEASCLEFSHYGKLKNVTPMMSQMIIGMFVLVKSLVYVFLNQPWMFIPGISLTKGSSGLVNNLRSCSSVLYHIIMDYFRENMQINKYNQQFIRVDKRVKLLKYPPAAYCNIEEEQMPTAEALSNEVITGLYYRRDLNECFELNQDLVNKIKSLVQGCLEGLEAILSQAQEIRTNHMKTKIKGEEDVD